MIENVTLLNKNIYHISIQMSCLQLFPLHGAELRHAYPIDSDWTVDAQVYLSKGGEENLSIRRAKSSD